MLGDGLKWLTTVDELGANTSWVALHRLAWPSLEKASRDYLLISGTIGCDTISMVCIIGDIKEYTCAANTIAYHWLNYWEVQTIATKKRVCISVICILLEPLTMINLVIRIMVLSCLTIDCVCVYDWNDRNISSYARIDWTQKLLLFSNRGMTAMIFTCALKTLRQVQALSLTKQTFTVSICPHTYPNIDVYLQICICRYMKKISIYSYLYACVWHILHIYIYSFICISLHV